VGVEEAALPLIRLISNNALWHATDAGATATEFATGNECCFYFPLFFVGGTVTTTATDAPFLATHAEFSAIPPSLPVDTFQFILLSQFSLIFIAC